MKTACGFDNKETSIEIRPQSNGNIELWINQSGLVDEKSKETLSYITVEELLALQKEIQSAVRDLFNL